MINCINHKGEPVSLPKDKFKFRPSVYAMVRNGNRICVCRSKSSGKYWFPGGGIELGEGLLDALKRELDEEAGLTDVQIGRQMGVVENFFYYGPTDEAMHAFLIFYECHSEQTELKTNDQVQDAEATDFQWVEIDSIKREDFNDVQDELLALISSLSR